MALRDPYPSGISVGKGEMGKELKRKNRRMLQTDKKPGRASGKFLCLLVKAAALMANS